MVAVNAKGGIVAAGSLRRSSRPAASGVPAISIRMSARASSAAVPLTEADYDGMMRERARLVHAMAERLAALDVLLMPTTSIVAPTIAEVEDRKVFAARNAAVLRNTSIVNFFDLCAISLPLPTVPDTMPVGLMAGRA